MVKVSVIMPVYNAERYVASAIESILNQTFTDFEFIIINDGSSYSTAEIVKCYNDERIVFINNSENQGIVKVLNQGLALCKGMYIARMDSDDISLPQRFEKQVAYLDSHPDVGILGTSMIAFSENHAEKVLKKKHVTYLDTILCCPIVHPSVMMRKSVIEEHNLLYRPEYKHAEDYDLWARAVRYTKIENLPDILLKYRYHDSNISIVYNSEQNEIADSITDYMIDYLTDIPELKLKLKKLSRLTRFYNPAFLSRHMLKHHPIRWFRLKKSIKGGLL